MQYDRPACQQQLLSKFYPNINDDCMFKFKKLESAFFNDCGHIINNVVCIEWFLHLEDSSNFQTVDGMLHQLMDPGGEILEGF